MKHISVLLPSFPLVVLAACGSNLERDSSGASTGSPDAGSCPDGGVPPSCAPKCGASPTLLVDASTFVSPDAGFTGVSPPRLGVNATDLFYTVDTTNLTANSMTT